MSTVNQSSTNQQQPGPSSLLEKYQRMTADQHKEVTPINAFTLLDVATLPDQRWYVDGLIGEGTITLIHAEPKAGKSYVIANLVLSIAAGRPDWLGMKIDFPEDAAALWIDLDMGHGRALRRLDEVANGIEDGYAGRAGAFSSFYIFTPETFKQYHIGKFDLYKGTSINELIQFIEQHNVKLVVLDTLSQLRGASNENDAGDMTQVFNTIKDIRDITGAAFVAIHHSKKDSLGTGKVTARGSSAIYAEPDTVLHLTKDKDDPCYLTLEVEAGRDIEQRKIGMYQTWQQRISAGGHAMYDKDGRAIIRYQLEPSDLKDHKSTSALEAYKNLLAYIKANPGKNRTQLYEAREEHGVTANNILTIRLSEMVDAGWIRFEKQGRSQLYYAVEIAADNGNEQPAIC